MKLDKTKTGSFIKSNTPQTIYTKKLWKNRVDLCPKKWVFQRKQQTFDGKNQALLTQNLL